MIRVFPVFKVIVLIKELEFDRKELRTSDFLKVTAITLKNIGS